MERLVLFLKGLKKYHLSKVSLAEFFKLFDMTKNIIFYIKKIYIYTATHTLVYYFIK